MLRLLKMFIEVFVGVFWWVGKIIFPNDVEKIKTYKNGVKQMINLKIDAIIFCTVVR